MSFRQQQRPRILRLWRVLARSAGGSRTHFWVEALDGDRAAERVARSQNGEWEPVLTQSALGAPRPDSVEVGAAAVHGTAPCTAVLRCEYQPRGRAALRTFCFDWTAPNGGYGVVYAYSAETGQLHVSRLLGEHTQGVQLVRRDGQTQGGYIPPHAHILQAGFVPDPDQPPRFHRRVPPSPRQRPPAPPRAPTSTFKHAATLQPGWFVVGDGDSDGDSDDEWDDAVAE